MPDTNEPPGPASSSGLSVAAPVDAPRQSAFGWFFPVLRVSLVIAAGGLCWYVAGHWNRWTGAARYEATDDAYTAGDVTPLAAKVSGYVSVVGVRTIRPSTRAT